MKVENNFTFLTIETDCLHFVHHVAILVTYWVLQFVQTAWTLSERSLHLLLSRKLFFPMIWHIIQSNEANWCYLWGSTAVRLRIWVFCDVTQSYWVSGCLHLKGKSLLLVREDGSNMIFLIIGSYSSSITMSHLSRSES